MNYMNLLSLTLPGDKQIQAPSSIDHLAKNAGPFGQNIIQTTIQLLFLLAILLALFFLIWGGIQWMTSGGDKEGLAKAQHTIIYVIIGLVLIFLSFFIINMVGGFFDLKLI